MPPLPRKKGVLPKPAPGKKVQKQLVFSSLAEKIADSQRRAITPAHVVVQARAGTGKTTTLCQGLYYLKGRPVDIEPSVQQTMVWDALMQSREAKTIALTSFGNRITDDLKPRVPHGCDVMTTHVMGRRSVSNGLGRFDLPEHSDWVVRNRIGRLIGKDAKTMWDSDYERDRMEAIRHLVGYCKVNLTGDPEVIAAEGWAKAIEQITDDELHELRSVYDVDVVGDVEYTFDCVRKVLAMCLDPLCDGQIDFNDMIWLPVVHNLPLHKYDLLLVDEAQDLNRCQQALVLRAGRRLIFVGDDRQAIYAYAGADCYSLMRMVEQMGRTTEGCVLLPLTVTRRCGHTIVKEAQKLVPDFEAHPGNCEGAVIEGRYSNSDPTDQRGTYLENVREGDMVLCRVNAPLVSQCFRLLKTGRRANIQGRSMAKNLVGTVNKLQAVNTVELGRKLDDWYEAEVAIENDRPKPSEVKLMTLKDKHDCIEHFIANEPSRSVFNVVKRIQSMFSNQEGDGVNLSSIHAAKGLEAKNVWLIQPKGATIPHPCAKTRQAKEQEYNLLYVGITRAINQLAYIS